MNRQITVVGLGPGDYRYLSIEAEETLRGCSRIYGRTMRHPVMESLKNEGVGIETFDSWYEEADDFESLYRAIAEALIAKAEDGPLLYAVPGNPYFSERTVELLREAEAKGELALRIIKGSGCIDAVLNALDIDQASGIMAVEPDRIPAGGSETPLLVFQIDTRMAAAQVKLRLMACYPDDHPVTVVTGAGISDVERCISMALYELDQGDHFDHVTTLYVPPMESNYLSGRMNDLVALMARLRGPEGCPWDIKQTHKSLLPYLIEEAYEVVEAVETEDFELMEEELGDLLLQIVFHSQIADENGYFKIQDVIRGVCEKMIRRHPHVFSDVVAETPEAVLTNWEAIKKEEKQESGQYASMERIPRHLPALMRSAKIQKKAAEVGFDWDSVHGALEKVEEEFKELTDILDSHDMELKEGELGDLLFAVVNVARFLHINPEQALERTISKFMTRYKYVEDKSEINGINMKECGLEVLDKFWNEAKTMEKLQKVQKRT